MKKTNKRTLSINVGHVDGGDSLAREASTFSQTRLTAYCPPSRQHINMPALAAYSRVTRAPQFICNNMDAGYYNFGRRLSRHNANE